MRAVIAEKHGGPEVLRPADIDTPTPGPGQLLVDVVAAGVNFADIYRRQGHPPYAGDLPYVAGSEGAGTVTAAGPGAGRVGERVAATLSNEPALQICLRRRIRERLAMRASA